MKTLTPPNRLYKKESDKKKIEYLFHEYRRLMFRKAYGILKDRGLAEKALYEAYVQLWKNIDKVGDPAGSHAVVLAFTIAKNCAYALMESSPVDEKPANPDGDFNAAGIEEALYVMPASAITKVLNRLGGENKNIFLLKYAYGFSIHKIAGTLNDNEANIGARLYKAQRRLRTLLLRGEF